MNANPLPPYPDTWVPQEGDKLVYDVDQGTQEWDTVLGEFCKGVDRKIIKIERIQNPELWARYQSQVKHIKRSNNGDANEIQYMKHGTNETDPAFIIQNNFDIRYSKGGPFGRAVYFAFDSHMASRYSVPGHSNLAQIFLARVAAGRIENRAGGNILHPSKGYHSVQGVVDPPYEALMIYELHQAYPDYLVTYEFEGSQ